MAHREQARGAAETDGDEAVLVDRMVRMIDDQCAFVGEDSPGLSEAVVVLLLVGARLAPISKELEAVHG